jgi:hypothetical protein
LAIVKNRYSSWKQEILISMSPLALWLCIVLLVGSCAAEDIPFVFDETTADVAGYSSAQLEQAHFSTSDLAGVPAVTQIADNEVLDFPITGGGDAPTGTTEKRVIDLKTEFDTRVEPENSRVNKEAIVLALKYPGDLTIDQIAAIYGYLKYGDESNKGWGYVRDPRGIDYLRYANETLEIGDEVNCVGGGDCDDFAILMAALVESVGGTTRIILARNNTIGGHAYAEVYLGQLNAVGSQVEPIIDWLKGKFNTGKIYTHIDTDTKDVWLNLDWGPDEEGNAHPGGPFYQGDKHIVLCIRDKYVKTPLKLPEVEVVFPDQMYENVTNMTNQTLNGKIESIEPDEAMFPDQMYENMPPAIRGATDQMIENTVLNLNYIWSFSGIEAGPITMAINQDGSDLFGQAKYEPERGIAWNAELVGSVEGNTVELTMTAQKNKELVTTKMTGQYGDDTINGNFTQLSGGQKIGDGAFSAMWICPGTSSYTPAIINTKKKNSIDISQLVGYTQTDWHLDEYNPPDLRLDKMRRAKAASKGL